METALVGTKIVERVADRKGIEPVEFNVLLHDVIDVDALEALTNVTGDRQQGAHLRVEFMYYGYAVTVDGRGRVIIDEQPTEAEPDESSRKESVND